MARFELLFLGFFLDYYSSKWEREIGPRYLLSQLFLDEGLYENFLVCFLILVTGNHFFTAVLTLCCPASAQKIIPSFVALPEHSAVTIHSMKTLVSNRCALSLIMIYNIYMYLWHSFYNFFGANHK